MDPHFEPTPGERELLADAESDDVSFDWILVRLGLAPDSWDSAWRPTVVEVEQAFTSLERLSRAGLLRVGTIEYVDGGPPGRVGPVRHTAEPIPEVKARVLGAVASASNPFDWAFSCWAVGG